MGKICRNSGYPKMAKYSPNQPKIAQIAQKRVKREYGEIYNTINRSKMLHFDVLHCQENFEEPRVPKNGPN